MLKCRVINNKQLKEVDDTSSYTKLSTYYNIFSNVMFLIIVLFGLAPLNYSSTNKESLIEVLISY